MSQPQLLQIPLQPTNIVYTPDWVACDIVDFFKPSGRILEPCKGDGAFLKYLPSADWCEIQEGRDFFAWNTPVDWVVGNPPYAKITKWFEHSFEIANNVLFLIPLQYLWVSTKRIKMFAEYGGLAHSRVYPESAFRSWSINFATGAVHIKKGYGGGMYSSIAALPSNKRLHLTAGTGAPKKRLSNPKASPASQALSSPTSGLPGMLGFLEA